MPEVHGAAEQRIRERDERRGEVEQRLDPQHIGDDRLAVVARGNGRERKLGERESSVQDDQHAEQLADLAPADLGRPHQAARQAIAVEHVEEGQHDLGHREQPIVGGAEDADDEDGGRPLDELGENLAPRAPQNRVPDRPAERFTPRFRRLIRDLGGAGHPGMPSAQLFTTREPRRNPRVFQKNATIQQKGFDGRDAPT